MKYIVFMLVIISLLAGCSRTKSIEFCEGISPEGKGVNCGGEFIEGELLAIISSREPFGVNSITVQVQEVKGGKKQQVDTITVDVKPDGQTATANLSLYSGGTYLVRALKKDEMIGEGEIVIREQ
ncbi:MAG TPA: hypothetical protein PK307_00920 [Spirochaetota bacterium]|nr:hypothetical protein [Spirochaetota bacterium]HOD14691.1 hypothetical protein [Spirochaetota bacterium]HPG51149.1 hypothetical protein [Spirochaetota bacterium]HPN11183.1 hypothetical protein [Spirochaetota bacterium]HQL80734.1 hypothetical protein [Spirochaetota bacterium]